MIRTALLLALLTLSLGVACTDGTLNGELSPDTLDRDILAVSSISRQYCGITDIAGANTFVSGSLSGGTTVIMQEDTLGSAEMWMFYPASGTSLPLVLLMQGANVNNFYYSRYAARIAAEGFAVFVPDQCASLSGIFALFASTAAVEALPVRAAELNADSSSALFGRLDLSNMGLVGHSYGGVVGLSALTGACEFPFCFGSYSRPAALKSGVFYGTSNPGGNVSTGGLPVGLIQGSLDSLNTTSESQTTYNALGTSRMLAVIDGANHYGLTDIALPEDARADANAQTLDQTTSIENAAQISAEFLKADLKNDAAAVTNIYSGGLNLSGVTVTAER